MSNQNGTKMVRCWVSRWGTLCGVLAMLVFVTGCSPVGEPCDVDSECDDSNPCNGSEICNLELNVSASSLGSCVEGTPPDCDDGDACTTDSCSSVSGCQNTPVECLEGGECDPATGECRCMTDAECDDSDDCTTDACVNDVCEHTPVDCNDGDACTTDSCEFLMGCVHEPVSCPPTEVCNPDTGCEPIACEIDADCDDGVFCNGAETCDALPGLDGTCQPGGDPCPDQDCDEVSKACVGGTTTGLLGAVGSYSGSGVCGDSDDDTVSLTADAGTLVLGGFEGNDDIALTLTDDNTATATNVTAFGIGGHDLTLTLNPKGTIALGLVQPDTSASCNATLTPN